MRNRIIRHCLVFTALVAVIYIGFQYEPVRIISDFLKQDVHPILFVLLMAVLPVIGFSIMVFLLLVGMKFGTWGGLAVTLLLMIFHVAASYYLTHSFFRQRIIDLLGKYRLRLPRFPHRGGRRISFLFMLVPGPPYAVKNYLLALSGLPFPSYFGISLGSQFLLAIPVVILGDAVMRLDMVVLLLIMALIMAGSFFLSRQTKEGG